MHRTLSQMFKFYLILIAWTFVQSRFYSLETATDAIKDIVVEGMSASHPDSKWIADTQNKFKPMVSKTLLKRSLELKKSATLSKDMIKPQSLLALSDLTGFLRSFESTTILKRYQNAL